MFKIFLTSLFYQRHIIPGLFTGNNGTIKLDLSTYDIKKQGLIVVRCV